MRDCGGRIDIGAVAGADLGPSFTISFWVHLDALGNARFVDRWGNQYLVSLSGSNWLFALQAGGQQTMGASPAAATNTKYHVCFTHKNPTMCSYINGNRSAITVAADAGMSGGACYFGANPGGEPMDGRLGHVAFWKGTDAALTQAEVTALTKGVSPLFIRPKLISGYWPLWGLGPEEVDLSGNKSNGVLQGTAVAPEINPIGQLLPLAY
jgi:hypothetical protein